MGVNIKIGGKTLYATATGLRVGSKGKVQPAGEILGQLPKGDRRRVRKQLRAGGFVAHCR